MLIKVLIIGILIYYLIRSGSSIKIPHPGLQATVDVFKAANLNDDDIHKMTSEFVRYSDAQNKIAAADSIHAQRLKKLTDPYTKFGPIRFNYKVYVSDKINAFATADGSIRVFSGLMDAMNDDQVMAIIGHEIAHVLHEDTKEALRTAYLSSAVRNALGAAGGTIGALSGSVLGSLAQQYTSAQFSQNQENEADDYSFDFIVRNGIDPYAMADALATINRLSQAGGKSANNIAQMFATHPHSAERAARLRAKADKLVANRQLNA